MVVVSAATRYLPSSPENVTHEHRTSTATLGRAVATAGQTAVGVSRVRDYTKQTGKVAVKIQGSVGSTPSQLKAGRPS